jgi:hypothetical protein
MGQQQLLLIILGIIVVAVAIVVGISQFGAHSAGSNKDAITQDLTAIAADAYEYKIRPLSLGGGRPSYAGYSIPSKFLNNDNAGYAISGTPTATQIVFTGSSTMNTSWVATLTADDSGKTSVTYAGW